MPRRRPSVGRLRQSHCGKGQQVGAALLAGDRATGATAPGPPCSPGGQPVEAHELREGPTRRRNSEHVKVPGLQTHGPISQGAATREVVLWAAHGVVEALGLPSLLVINFMIPNYPPSGLLKKKVSDGPGWNLVIHCRLADATLADISAGRTPPSVELFRRFVDPVNGSALRKNCLKCIFGAVDPNEPGFNMVTRKLVTSYNFKPFLSKTASSFYRAKSYFEIDIDIHTWGQTALSGFNSIKSRMSRMNIRGGIVIEADGDEQMPEQMLFANYLSHMDPTMVDPFPAELTAWLSDARNHIPPLTCAG